MPNSVHRGGKSATAKSATDAQQTTENQSQCDYRAVPVGEEPDGVTLGGLKRVIKTDEATINRRLGGSANWSMRLSRVSPGPATRKARCRLCFKEEEKFSVGRAKNCSCEYDPTGFSGFRDGYCREGREEGTRV